MIRSTALLFVATLSAAAQYFPLQVGNQWIYRLSAGPLKESRTAEITAAETINGQDYFVYRGIFGETARIRLTSDNRLVARATDGAEVLWADFNAAERDSFPTSFDNCTGQATVESRSAKSSLFDLAWENGFQVAYAPAQCADAGVAADLYFPGLGLASRTYQSFSGPRVYELAYARIGKVTYSAEGEIAFRLSLNKSVFTTPALMQLRMTLANTTGEPLELNYRSGQSFDVQIRDDAGKTLYTWSANKLFTAALRQESVTGERNWVLSEEIPLPLGSYVLEAYLTTTDRPVYRAQLPFEVR
jgi:hypothetical protein